MNKSVLKMVTSGVLIALASVLSMFTIYKMPNGGSVTLLSTLPIIIIGYCFGVRWGCFSGFVYGIMQLLVFGGLADLKGISLATVVGSVILDFLLAFSVVGLGGILRKKIKAQVVSLTLGTIVAVALRFICHFISGFILWGSIAKDGFGAVAYSFVYNITYMGPEFVFTVLGAILIGSAINFSKKDLRV